MVKYRLFALDADGRVDRGFEQSFRDDDDAIRFAATIEGAAVIEIMRERALVARVLNRGGRTTVVPAL